jgi:hypothetical protein
MLIGVAAIDGLRSWLTRYRTSEIGADPIVR